MWDWPLLRGNVLCSSVAFRESGLGSRVALDLAASDCFQVCSGHGDLLPPEHDLRDLSAMFVPRGRSSRRRSRGANQSVAFTSWGLDAVARSDDVELPFRASAVSRARLELRVLWLEYVDKLAIYGRKKAFGHFEHAGESMTPNKTHHHTFHPHT